MYLVSPSDATEWEFEQEFLVSNLSTDWDLRRNGPLVQASGVRSGRVVASIIFEDSILEVGQNAAHPEQCLDLEGSLTSIAAFAAWWRGKVTDAQSLVLCDQAFNVVIPLAPGITDSEILRALD